MRFYFTLGFSIKASEQLNMIIHAPICALFLTLFLLHNNLELFDFHPGMLKETYFAT